MHLTIHNRALLRGVLAGAVALAGASACSRSDRADTGRDTSQTGAAVAPADTQTSTATATDTARVPTSETGAASQTATPRPQIRRQDTSVSGKATKDTAVTEVTGAAADTTTRETINVADSTGDTTAVGYEPMARDTSLTLAQGDTTGQARVDTTAEAYPDTATIHARVDTTTETQAEVAVGGHPDTVTVVGDSSSVDKPGPRAKEDTVSRKADSLAKYHEADRVRPPEDSTETLGNVTTDRANADVEAVGDANADGVGAAQVESTGNIVTGADAVALMGREGRPCVVVDSEDSREVLWDLSRSPATLNPCGTGTMTLPKVQMGEER